MIRVLITGFGPFPGVADNPSEWLVRRLQRTLSSRGRRCVAFGFAVLPTEWRALPRLHGRLWARHRPHLALHFGVSARAACLHVEQRAHNLASGRADARGEARETARIARHAPHALASPLSAHAIALHLERRGLPARASHDAGAYLCNMAYFLSLARARAAPGRAAALFVHIPPVGSSAGERARLLQGALAVVAQAIHQARGKRFRRAPIRAPLAPDLLITGDWAETEAADLDEAALALTA